MPLRLIRHFVFRLVLKGKKVCQVLVDGTQEAVKRLAGDGFRENECFKRIVHFGRGMLTGGPKIPILGGGTDK